MSVIVVGDGIAGTAAVYAALQHSLECTWLGAGIGASAASCGAFDWLPWHGLGAGDDVTTAEVPSATLRRFGEELFAWQWPAHDCVVVTPEGLVRTARACDAGVLQLGRLGEGVRGNGPSDAVLDVAVLDVGRPGWDAARLSAALNTDPWMQHQGLRFAPLLVDVTELGLPSSLSDVEWARELGPSLPQFAELLARAVETRKPTPRAVLAGPWLFADAASVAAIHAQPSLQRHGLLVGETLAPPFGVAGHRFEASRAAFAARHPGLKLLRARALRVEADGAQWRVHLADAARSGSRGTATESVSAERCVLALGGVASGAVQLDAQQRLGLNFSLEPVQSLYFGGRPLLAAASQTGFALQGFGLEALTQVGLRARPGNGSLRVVGDLEADQPRTLLRAAQSGLDAFEP